ncbi:hypothetical protein ACVBEQ_05900 [Nakamurella sp. GG22]
MTRRPMVLVTSAVLILAAACGTSSNGGQSTSSTPAASSPAALSPAVSSSAAPGSPGSVASALSARPSSTGSAGPSSTASGPTPAEQAEYCTSKGGEVQTRDAYWGTNGDEADWVTLAGSTTMCRFQSDDEAKSRIYVDLTTLSSPVPTLAALAYLSKVPLPSTTGGANPATGYCSKELGGSSTFGGISAAGGGWVAKSDPDDVVVALCVFPDLSFIDEWGLAYHSDGSIRGTDLATAMAYQPTGPLPPVFPSGDAAAPTS